MKTLQRAILTLFLFTALTSSYAQSNKELAAGYYVVVGSYAASRENIAQNYTEVLNREGHEASYGFNASKNMYFVYVRFFDNLKSSLEDMYRTRKQEKFNDAWVRVVPGDVVKTNASTPAVGEKNAAGRRDETPKTPISKAENETKTNADLKSRSNNESVASELRESDQLNADDTVVENAEIKQFEKMTLGNTEVFLSLFHAQNNRIVHGDVQVVDTERAKQLLKVKGNEYLLLPDPKSKSGQLTLICEAFGYRKIQQEINYPLPLADTVKPYIDLMGTTLVINFDLVRYRRGDIVILYNVYFFNDASIMLPESKYELNSLLQLMQEGNYKIRLHGHTNGNYHGRILTRGDSKDFFVLEGSKSTMGSAKDLSRNRAEIIKEYLVSNGIAADRIEIKAWGGKRPLYDRNGANAKKNVRVEVEILQE